MRFSNVIEYNRNMRHNLAKQILGSAINKKYPKQS